MKVTVRRTPLQLLLCDEAGVPLVGLVAESEHMTLWSRLGRDDVELTPTVAAELAEALRSWVNTRPANWTPEVTS